jgi:hypothetical protein
MKTYQQLMNEIAPTGAQVKVTRRIGSGVGSGDTRAGAGVSFANSSGTRQGGVNIDIGKKTDSGNGDRVSQGISKAIEKPGVPSSTSSPVNSRVTANVSGNLSGRSEPEKKEPPKPKKENEPEVEKIKRVKDKKVRKEPPKVRKDRTTEPPEEPKFRDTLAGKKRGQEKRLANLQKKNKFKTKYRYAVPTGSGGRFNTKQASGPNQMTDFKPVKTNRTGGTNYQRTKVVGDPMGSGGTGRTVGANRYDKLFGKGGRYEPAGDGSTKYVNPRIGKPFNPKGYQPNKFVR